MVNALVVSLLAFLLLRDVWAYCEGFYAPKARKSPATAYPGDVALAAAMNQMVLCGACRHYFLPRQTACACPSHDHEGDVNDFTVTAHGYPIAPDTLVTGSAFPAGWGRNREAVAVHIEADTDADAVDQYLKGWGV